MSIYSITVAKVLRFTFQILYTYCFEPFYFGLNYYAKKVYFTALSVNEDEDLNFTVQM